MVKYKKKCVLLKLGTTYMSYQKSSNVDNGVLTDGQSSFGQTT